MIATIFMAMTRLTPSVSGGRRVFVDIQLFLQMNPTGKNKISAVN